MGLPKIHNLVGHSSQEEKSVQGLGSFLEAALFIYKGETNSCVTWQESSHRSGFLCFQLPPTVLVKYHTQNTHLPGLFPGPHTMLAQASISIWFCACPTLLPLSRLASHPHSPFPKTALHQSSPSQRLCVPQQNKRACGLGRDLCAGWRFQASHQFAACIPKRIARAF